MGGLPPVDSRRFLVLPDTPPQLVSPSASSFSSRSSPSADQFWDRRPPVSIPMSHYEKGSAVDMSGDRNVDGTHGRPASTAPPRQQLPSLSSLFGPPTARSLNSPVSERPGSYSATSPMDRPRLPSADRNHPPSYFPHMASPPVSQPRSTFDAERQQHPTLSRSYSSSGSPRFREANHCRSDSRSDETSGKWSLQQETSRQEYSLGPRDHPLRSPRDQFRLQFPGVKDGSTGGYPEQRSHQNGPNPPPTPTSTVISEGTTGKDGLGPKIWTGSHFLPRFVRAAEVAGEGLCYFYDDGTHCKTVIDGEAVNAHWGVTKAGKPRKRLAIACVTCREKKIKCDPDFPRCVQCEKFGRICKFKNAPRGGNNTSPSTPPAELDDVRRMNGPRTNELRLSESDSGSPVSPRAVMHHGSPEAAGHKRLKLGPDSYVRNGEPPAMSRPLDHSKTQLVMQRPSPEASRIPDDVLTRAWRTDPYASDPHSITAAISQFFVQVDSSMILRFLPEEAFKSWVAKSAHRKSAEDLMLLYSMLAVGVTLSGGPKQIAFEYAQVAHYAQKTSAVNCLQLAQSRILLAMYYASTSRLCESNELMSSAAGTMACLQLNFELDKSREAGLPVYPFGMNKTTYCESRRRTFWSLYMLERLNGMYPDRLALINAEDIYTRLPADTQSFEKQLETHMPAFDPYELNLPKMSEQPLEMGPYVVEMVHIWATCVAGVYRLARRPTSSEVEIEKVQSLAKRVHEWHSALPTRYTFSGPNLESSALTGNVGSFLMMHLLYHHAMIKLNRHRQGASQLPTETLASLSQRCRNHATSIIEIVNSLDRILRVRPTILRTPPPAMAVAVVEALDVLTATGSVARISELIENVRVAKALVDNVANVWEEARQLSGSIEGRLEKLNRIRDRGSRPTSPIDGYRMVLETSEYRDEQELRWQMPDPFEKLYSKDIDVIYFSLE